MVKWTCSISVLWHFIGQDNYMNIFFKTFLFTLIAWGFAVPMITFASHIYVEVPTGMVNKGDEFKADVFLDTEGKSINALEGRISFPIDMLEVKDVESGNGAITFWIDTLTVESFSSLALSIQNISQSPGLRRT